MNYALDYLQARVADGKIGEMSEAELLSLVISNEQVAEAIIQDFGGFKGMANQPLEKFLRYDGLGDAKIIRMAACFEMAKRVVDQVVSELKFQCQLL